MDFWVKNTILHKNNAHSSPFLDFWYIFKMSWTFDNYWSSISHICIDRGNPGANHSYESDMIRNCLLSLQNKRTICDHQITWSSSSGMWFYELSWLNKRQSFLINIFDQIIGSQHVVLICVSCVLHRLRYPVQQINDFFSFLFLSLCVDFFVWLHH